MRFRRCVLALFAVVSLTFVSGCEKAESPEDALRSFVTAVKVGRAEVAYKYLTDDAQAVLEARAGAARKAAGSEEATEPHDLISSTGFASPYHIAEIARDGDPDAEGRLKLKVVTHGRGEHEVWMRLQGDTWRVELPLKDPPS